MPFAGVAPLDDDAAVDGTKLLQGAGRLGGAIIVSAPGLLHPTFDILIDQPGQPDRATIPGRANGQPKVD